MVAFDRRWQPVADVYRDGAPAHPQPGWVEKDAEAVVRSVEEALDEVAARSARDRIAAVGLDNEGETVVAWDAETLRPLAPAIVWSCRRSEAIVRRLREAGAEQGVRAAAGTPLDPYFSSTKIRWLLEDDEAVAAAAADRPGAVRDARRLRVRPAGDGPATDPSTAARTQLQAARPSRRLGRGAVRRSSASTRRRCRR